MYFGESCFDSLASLSRNTREWIVDRQNQQLADRPDGHSGTSPERPIPPDPIKAKSASAVQNVNFLLYQREKNNRNSWRLSAMICCGPKLRASMQYLAVMPGPGTLRRVCGIPAGAQQFSTLVNSSIE